MELIIALGSNIGERRANMQKAKEYLSVHFTLIKESKIIESEPVDYLSQPCFLNQVIEFETKTVEAEKILSITQSIEDKMGREKVIDKGPRNIDIDIIFFGDKIINTEKLIIPHPSWESRSFVKDPLKELPFYQKYLQ
ncbi:MAG: 2-amino-4-hydroxy-6-hydroxymethyldihydropteridine diphosphokinase [Bdellovibrionales bacterium]|jgi:2-amino-4-hydroxy-6-hydroxymethyldihydropteridine diphosphokinase|nr:2-amino-4-hydroxy-6-hydroxymethyldihydropteridine diphosphokinase [Bdellovibrionales bacterium]